MTILHNNILPTHNYDYMYVRLVVRAQGGLLKTLTWFGGHSIFFTGQYFDILTVSASPHTK